jgi:NAD(P)-dependent dehydrogenase (short-subunit alcohol dehydrogenase family)
MLLSEKFAVVTGASSGIGLATCEALAEAGVAGIGAVDLNDEVRQVCRRINGENGGEIMIPFVGDVTDNNFRRQVFGDLKQRFGVVHLCIPAAGITRDGLSVKIDKESGEAMLYPIEDFDKVLRINLYAPIYWAMEAIASMAEFRQTKGLGKWKPEEGSQGGVVLIGSVSSTGNKGQISYATAKSGLEGAQATLAMEAIFHGVRCCIIHPGYTDTPMVRSLGDDFIHNNILPNTQLRRLLRPDEIADGILFLLRNSAVSGSLWVDAGWHPVA